ncbi:MAG: serine protease [Roseomonas sp.]|nr:serine protease [Roseomonas sp.]
MTRASASTKQRRRAACQSNYGKSNMLDRSSPPRQKISLPFWLCFAIYIVIYASLSRNSFAQAPTSLPDFQSRFTLGLIHLTVRGDDPDFGGRPVAPRSGTAFFIGDRQRIITARHLFTSSNGREPLRNITIAARLGSHVGREVGVDPTTLRLNPEHDVAMLRASTPGLGETNLPLCFRHRPVAGQIVIALGFPLGRGADQTDLRVRAPLGTGLEGFPSEAMVVGGGLNEGNSGGPVMSLGGTVAGVVIGGVRGGGATDLGAVLPLRVLQQWILQVADIQEQCEQGVDAPQAASPRQRREYAGEVILTEREINAGEVVALNAILRGVPLARGRDGQVGRDGPPGSPGSGSGADGSPGGNGTPGGPGQNGASASEVVIRAGTLIGNLTIDNSGADGGSGGKGGNGGPGGAGSRGASAVSGAFDCRAGPGRGGNGGRGGDAGPGGPAGRGGDAGRILVILDRWTPGATLDLVARGGQPGDPGPPGATGSGGRQGEEGDASGLCRSAGRSGSPGSPGAPMQAGAGQAGGADAEVVLIIGGVERRATGRLQHR